MQSTIREKNGLHVGIIMDGNGRWATGQGLPRSAGHRAGVRTVRRVVEGAPDLGIGMLTLFAFSADNWRRPADEVNTLMWLLRAYLRSEVPRLVENEVRITMIGRRDRLPAALCRDIRAAERATEAGRRLHVRVALDYSSREAIARAAAHWASDLPLSLDLFGKLVSQTTRHDRAAAQVDLLIRTGGEKRLSDFLLWESAYAELYFTDRMWPDFDAADLAEAVAEFHRRERRFGGLGATAPAAMIGESV